MECTKCSFNNPEQASFCGGCGSSITKLKCGQCKAENTAGSRSCNTCGQPLSATSELLSAHTQRRILSVLFCDLVDLTSLVVSLGPEVSRSVIRDFKVISKEAVEKLGGRVTTYLGDGIVALFSQHETNAERAINTALQINCDIEHIGKHFNLAPSEIKVCCGIATGLAIVGDDMLGHSQVRLETAVGLPMNLAARIQDFAEPGGVAIDQESYAATRGLFRFEDSGHHHLKGIREPQQIWKVLAEKSISSRFVAQAAEVSAMVDRVEILQELIGYWERSVDSDAQLVLFYGEAGVGKSRIAQEMVEIISMKTDYHHLEYQCSSYHRHTAFYPVINRMKAVAGIEPADTVGSQLAKLELLVKGSSTDMSRDMPAFADMLALPVDDTWPMSKIDPGAKKEWVFDTLVRNMLALADTAPLLISIEDVHWIDPTTLELINRVAREISGHEIMLLLTSRQGFADEFRELPGITILEVDRLPEKFAQQLFEQIKGEVNMSANLQAEILRRTEGIPLYIEELSKSLIEGMSADRSVFSEITPDKIVLPGTLQESLQSRLDRLPDTSKSIAQIAAVIGREFSFDLLEEVAGYRDKKLYQV